MFFLNFLQLVVKAGVWSIGFFMFAFVIYLIMNRKSVNRMALLWTIATAVKFEMPLPDLIRAQSRELRGKREQMLLDLASDLREGYTLAEVIDNYWLLLPEQGRLAIHVGTETGTLCESLEAAIECIERKPLAVIRNFMILFFYLAFVAFTCLNIVIFLLFYIVPTYQEIVLGFGIELPAITQLLIEASYFTSTYFYFFPLAFILLAPLFVFIASRISGGLDIPDRAYAKVPFQLRYFIPHLFWILVSPLMKIAVSFSPRRATSEILQSLAVAAKADHPLLSTIGSIAGHHKAGDIRRRLQAIKTRLEEGGELWSALREKGFISLQKASLLKAAEAAGGLAYALQEKSLEYEQGHFHRTVYMLEWLRMSFVLLLCFVTAFISISMFSPLIQLIIEKSREIGS